MNILIALYNSAYDEISGNATDEYMGLFALKTMQFVRAPDENVFIPRKHAFVSMQSVLTGQAFNLFEIIFLILPFEWWMPRERYAKLNNIVMGIIYSPLLVITASIEAREARRIRWNRRRGEADDDTVQEWEHAAEEVDFDLEEPWKQTVEETTPKVQPGGSILEVRQLREQVEELTRMVKALAERDGVL